MNEHLVLDMCHNTELTIAHHLVCVNVLARFAVSQRICTLAITSPRLAALSPRLPLALTQGLGAVPSPSPLPTTTQDVP